MQTITTITQEPIVMKIVTTMRIIFFLLGVVTTISTSRLFNSCNKPVPVMADASVISALQPVASQQAAVMAASEQHIAELQTENKLLAQQVKDTKTAIAGLYKKSATIETTLRQQVATASFLTDTTQRLSNCDSIANTATELLQSSEQKDSLHQLLTNGLEEQIGNRDSIIVVQEKQQNYLQLNYDRTFAQQQLLLSDNLHLQRQVKRQRVKSKLASVGMFLLGGTATFILLRH